MIPVSVCHYEVSGENNCASMIPASACHYEVSGENNCAIVIHVSACVRYQAKITVQ